MSRKWVSSIILPLIGLLLILGFAYGCDRLSDAIQRHISVYFDTTSIAIALPLVKLFSTLISIAGIILLFWMVMTSTSRSRVTGAIFLVVGILLAAYYVLSLNLTRVMALSFPFIVPLGPDTLLVQAASGIAVVGLLILALRKSIPA